MLRPAVERSLRDVHARLVKARQDLAVIDEQIMSVVDAADEARLRSLVSETPMAAQESSEAQRHADAFDRARRSLVDLIGELERRQDELLGKLVVD